MTSFANIFSITHLFKIKLNNPAFNGQIIPANFRQGQWLLQLISEVPSNIKFAGS